MKLIKDIRGNAAVLTLRGDFDSFVVPPFMEEVKALFKNDVRFLALDLRLVLFINSTAIGSLVKIHKEAEKAGGQLVLCRPSRFVHGVLESLGLLDLFHTAADPEEALRSFGANAKEEEMGEEGSVLLHVPGAGKRSIGKMAALDEKGIVLRLPPDAPEIAPDTECSVKFRLPLFRKGHYFEAAVRVKEAEKEKDGFRLKCVFEKMNEEDRKSVAQFVEEMKFLRSEARKKT